MKKYQKVLGKALKIIIIILGVVAGWFTSEKIQDNRKANRAAATWCLDNGGRFVTIDNVRACFQLTEVPIDSRIFGNPRGDCVANPAHVWTRFARGIERHCYSFALIKPEN